MCREPGCFEKSEFHILVLTENQVSKKQIYFHLELW